MYRDITVLLVEDDPTVATLADTKLSAKHFNVLRAPDKITALSLVEDADILVLDINLPNGDGKDVLTMWSKQLDVGPAMVITGYSMTDDEVPQAWTVLRKPFRMDRLVDFVERFASVVRGQRCCHEVVKLKRHMGWMKIAIAGLGGIEVLYPLGKAIVAGLAPQIGEILP